MKNIKIAYFSAEIGIDKEIKTYSGGLGILAGGTIKAMADLEVPFCAVTLLYTKGFLKQNIENNYQIGTDDPWDFNNILEDTGKEVKVNISGENVFIKIFKYEYKGVTGHKVPIYYLDTNIEKNLDSAKKITERLYYGDRISQEIVLGIGGVRALEALGHEIEKYHMNEGHSAFLTLELYKKLGEEEGFNDDHVKNKCIFTTHTPIPAGHDKFSYETVYERLKGEPKIIPWHIKNIAGEKILNTTVLALNMSNFHNAVSKKHKEVTENMFGGFEIDYITNGVHLSKWVNKYLKDVFNRYIPNWEKDFTQIKEVMKVPNSEIYKAHLNAKKDMIDYINNSEDNINQIKLDNDILTIGFARRFIEYKNADMIFTDIEALKKLGKKVQFIFSGKSHDNDGIGKDIMRNIIEKSNHLKEHINIVFLKDYDMEKAQYLVSGCDIWLNTPTPPNEASGTSGMKASANGCLHFSTLDGWAIEAFEMNGGGFPIKDYEDFMTTLHYKLIPMFYSKDKTSWTNEMKLSIGISGSYFNTHRMAKEYIKKAYKLQF